MFASYVLLIISFLVFQSLVGVLHGVTTDAFWDEIFDVARQAADDYGIELILDRYEPQPSQDILCQRMQTDISNYCKGGYIDGLFVTVPCDNLEETIKECVQFDTNLVVINSGAAIAEAAGVNQFIGQLEENTGFKSAEKLIELGAKRLVCLNHEPGSLSLAARCRGFNASIAQNPANAIYLGEIIVPLDNSAQYRFIVEQAVGETGNWDGVGLMLGGASQTEEGLALYNSHRGAIVGSFDTSARLSQGIKEGKIKFAVDQNAWMQGANCWDSL